MAVTFYLAGSGSFATPAVVSSTTTAAPGTLSVPCPITGNVQPGDFLVAVISWRTIVSTGPPAPNVPTMSVADDVHNWWEPVSSVITSGAGGFVRSTIWIAPAVRPPTVVYVAPTSFSPAIACTVFGVNGVGAPWLTITPASVGNSFANAASSISVSVTAPATSAAFLTVVGVDSLTPTMTLSGTAGWSQQTGTSAGNGVDHTSDINAPLGVLTTSGAGTVTATWTPSAGTPDLSMAIFGFLTPGTALASRSPNWPVTIFECAPGFGLQTPPDQLTWTPLTATAMKLDVTQGRQYEVAQLAAGEGTLLLDNPLGLLIPPGSGSFSGINSGTPVRMRTAWLGGAWQVQFHGDGVTQFPGINAPAVAVLPSTTYSASAWMASSSSTTGFIQLDWQDATHTHISFSTALPTLNAAATLITVSGQSPANAAFVRFQLGCFGTPASSVIFSTAAAFPGNSWILPPGNVTWAAGDGATVTTLAPWVPDPKGPPNVSPWYVPFSGFIERLPQQWDDQLRGRVEATVTDAWFGANYVPLPVLFEEILNDNPYAYWPCTDAAGSTAASNLAPGNTNPLFVTVSKYGAAGVTQQFGQNTQALLGAQATTLITANLRISQGAGMWQETLPNVGPAGGYCLFTVDPAFPKLSNGITFEIWLQAVSPFTTNGDPVMLLAYGVKGLLAGSIFAVSISTTNGHLQFNYDPVLGTTVNIGVTGVDYRSMTAPILVAVTVTTTTFTTYVNGVQTATGSYTPAGTQFLYLTINGSPIQAGAFTPSGTSGFVGHVAVFSYILHPARILTHYQAGFTAMQQEPAAYRIERLLAFGFATGRRLILQESSPDQTPVVSCQDVPGSPASASVNNLVSDLLPGMFYVAPTGDMVYLSKKAAWNQAIVWTLGENLFAGEDSFMNDITFDYDPSRVINQIELTQLDNQDIVIPSVGSSPSPGGPGVPSVELASQIQYGTLSDITTGYLWGDATVPYTYGAGLYDITNWIANIYANPHLRLVTAKVDASSNPILWSFILGASVGDMITVNRRSLGQGTPVISVTGRITQTHRTFEYNVSGVSAAIDLVIDPAPEEFALTCDDSVRGVLNGTNVLAW